MVKFILDVPNSKFTDLRIFYGILIKIIVIIETTTTKRPYYII